MAQEPKLKPVKLTFHKKYDVPLFHADGAWAVKGSNDDIVVKFYLEHTTIPNVATFSLKPDGTVSGEPEINQDDDDVKYYSLVREFQAGVVLSLSAAKAIHKMLGQHIEFYDNKS